tara:strand:+ start:333 stop:479 length:147 start_codon:yes stop_codon:yes gene_type:complete
MGLDLQYIFNEAHYNIPNQTPYGTRQESQVATLPQLIDQKNFINLQDN